MSFKKSLNARYFVAKGWNCDLKRKEIKPLKYYKICSK